jgi:hypothetical protein
MPSKIPRALIGVLVGLLTGTAIGVGTENWAAAIAIGTGIALVFGGSAILMDASGD